MTIKIRLWVYDISNVDVVTEIKARCYTEPTYTTQ